MSRPFNLHMAREVLTLQCGRLSNFIGAYWWNVQETEGSAKEIQRACTFREGRSVTTGSPAYTPRLMILDVAADYGEEAYPEDIHCSTLPTWDGQVETHTVAQSDCRDKEKVRPDVKKCKLSSDLESWSDILRVPLSKKSRVPIPNHYSSLSFEIYPWGLEVWGDRQLRTAVEEQLHYFAEECDSLQGFHLLSELSTGFGALANCVAEFIADEYAPKSVLAFATTTEDSDDKATAVNTCLALNGLISNATLVSPLALSSTPLYQDTQSYRASGISIAAALDTVTLFYRCCSSPANCTALCDAVTTPSRKIAVLSASVPLPLDPAAPLSVTLDERGGLRRLLRSFAPAFTLADDVLWKEAVSLRGVPSNQILWPSTDLKSLHSPMIQELLADQLTRFSQYHHWTTSVVNEPLPLFDATPHGSSPLSLKPAQVPACAALQSRSGVGDYIDVVCKQLSRVDLRTLPAFSATCLDVDDYGELRHNLESLRDNYRGSVWLED